MGHNQDSRAGSPNPRPRACQSIQAWHTYTLSKCLLNTRGGWQLDQMHQNMFYVLWVISDYVSLGYLNPLIKICYWYLLNASETSRFPGNSGNFHRSKFQKHSFSQPGIRKTRSFSARGIGLEVMRDSVHILNHFIWVSMKGENISHLARQSSPVIAIALTFVDF